MAHWLVKEEPTHYAFSDLVRDGTTPWSGVRNPLARRHLGTMRPGDTGFYYHTGTERAIVGVFEVDRVPSGPRPLPLGAAVTFRAVRPLLRPVPLRDLRERPDMAGFDLVRISRLSVLPVPDATWKTILALGGSADSADYGSSSRPAASRRRALSRKRGSA